MQNTLRGIAAGFALIVLAIAYFVNGSYFLPILFTGLAIAVLVGSFSFGNAKVAYGGLQGFIWLQGLAFCYLPRVSFWPWILVVATISVILGVFAVPIVKGLQRMSLFNGISMASNQQPQPVPQESGQRYTGPQEGM